MAHKLFRKDRNKPSQPQSALHKGKTACLIFLCIKSMFSDFSWKTCSWVVSLLCFSSLWINAIPLILLQQKCQPPCSHWFCPLCLFHPELLTWQLPPESAFLCWTGVFILAVWFGQWDLQNGESLIYLFICFVSLVHQWICKMTTVLPFSPPRTRDRKYKNWKRRIIR